MIATMGAKPPPRLFVLMRPETDRAVVLRQGPSKVFCTLGWNLATDEVVVGQWCKHKIYVERCDISSDGKYFVYFALDGKWQSEAAGAWTALSLAPYLKAIKLWPCGSTWGGGGLLLKHRDQLPKGRSWEDLEKIACGDRLMHHAMMPERLIRDGWCSAGKGGGLTKPISSALTLQTKIASSLARYALVDRAGTVEPKPAWTWAEVDAKRERLVWAEAGVLHAARIKPRGLGAPHTIFDARDMTFEPIAAPYRNKTIIAGER